MNNTKKALKADFFPFFLCALCVGLWRVQVEHMVTHLKAHSQTSVDFQSAVKFLQMGKVRVYFHISTC